MKVLLVGCGSAGKRHLTNLISFEKIEHVYVFSKAVDAGIDTEGKVSVIGSLDGVRADFAVVANETYKHVDTGLALAEKKMHLFIEKPVSHLISKKLKQLNDIVIREKLKLAVGYNLRFLGAVRHVKSVLSKKLLGDIYFARLESGQYLPDWRPGRDYRDSYSSSKERGGGVALDLTHEIDLMRYLFGDPVSFKTVKKKISDLEIDSDDIFEGIYIYDKFICGVHTDYLQKDKKRFLRIEGSKGRLVCDQVKKKIILKTNGKEEIIEEDELFNLDRTYRDEMKSFICAIENDDEPEVVFIDGLKALELIEAGNV